ncbi:IclR family transcriptional regulator [Amycolatopsis sp. NPDC049253]|uniref:IclR family transcriptional regulator n=1 Tax=Amycolatopsis sp. NPDC049253 TaxID=3155274 RepID=UPI0034225026
MEQNSGAYRIEAVDRALTLLTLLSQHGHVTVTEASRELGVAPSTAHRLLSTLCDRGFAVRGDKRQYRPGPELLALATPGWAPPLADRVRPYLERLHADVGETVHLMVRAAADIRFVDGIESHHPLRVGLRTGARMPAYCTSGGKAMLADLDPADVTALHAAGLPPWPGEKIHDVKALHRELAAVRRNHFGLNQDESEAGVTAIGASIGVIDGQPAALAIAVPTARFASAGPEAMAAHLLRTCGDVREALTARAR